MTRWLGPEDGGTQATAALQMAFPFPFHRVIGGWNGESGLVFRDWDPCSLAVIRVLSPGGSDSEWPGCFHWGAIWVSHE